MPACRGIARDLLSLSFSVFSMVNVYRSHDLKKTAIHAAYTHTDSYQWIICVHRHFFEVDVGIL